MHSGPLFLPQLNHVQMKPGYTKNYHTNIPQHDILSVSAGHVGLQ